MGKIWNAKKQHNPDWSIILLWLKARNEYSECGKQRSKIACCETKSRDKYSGQKRCAIATLNTKRMATATAKLI